MEILIAIVSALGGLFLFRALIKNKADSGQKELEVKTAVLEEKVSNILDGVKEKDKETQDKVNEITKEQDKPVDNSQLVDWFRNRK